MSDYETQRFWLDGNISALETVLDRLWSLDQYAATTDAMPYDGASLVFVRDVAAMIQELLANHER